MSSIIHLWSLLVSLAVQTRSTDHSTLHTFPWLLDPPEDKPVTLGSSEPIKPQKHTENLLINEPCSFKHWWSDQNVLSLKLFSNKWKGCGTVGNQPDQPDQYLLDKSQTATYWIDWFFFLNCPTSCLKLSLWGGTTQADKVWHTSRKAAVILWNHIAKTCNF